jgi:hypothetical protein
VHLPVRPRDRSWIPALPCSKNAIQWCAERRNPPLYAASVAHHGLAGQPDATVWACDWEHDFVVVTTNAPRFCSRSSMWRCIQR